MKTAELTGAELDYWVAKAEGHTIERLTRGEHCDFDGLCIVSEGKMPSEIGNPNHYSPSRQWHHGGPIIEREFIQVLPMMNTAYWLCGYDRTPHCRGRTPLIAAMRAYVASRFGDEVGESDSKNLPSSPK